MNEWREEYKKYLSVMTEGYEKVRKAARFYKVHNNQGKESTTRS